MTIDDIWKDLYSQNSRIQAFAVSANSEIVWQTANWDLVGPVGVLLAAPIEEAPFVNINGVEYQRVASSPSSYIASAKGTNGHFLMERGTGDIWLMAWASPEADPELAAIDLAYAALKFEQST
jgi:hypothetical protein